MAKLHELDQAAADAWDLWKAEQIKANTAAKKADRAKDEFVGAFGDREKAGLPDGRVIQRISEQRNGYKVPDKTITRYILSAD
jgi:hypothetical protein